jgi:predicted nucleic acid-binding protein
LRKPRRVTVAAHAPVRVFVDTSAWLALVAARDAHHREAAAAFERLVERRVPLVTTNLVVAELHRLLLYRAGIQAARGVVRRVDKIERLTVYFPGRDDHDAAGAWLERFPDQRITYTDAVSFVVMTAARCTNVFTFDHDFAVAGFSSWQHVR